MKETEALLDTLHEEEGVKQTTSGKIDATVKQIQDRISKGDSSTVLLSANHYQTEGGITVDLREKGTALLTRAQNTTESLQLVREVILGIEKGGDDMCIESTPSFLLQSHQDALAKGVQLPSTYILKEIIRRQCFQNLGSGTSSEEMMSSIMPLDKKKTHIPCGLHALAGTIGSDGIKDIQAFL